MASFLSLLLAIYASFGSPVNYEISLAGNFGEPRPNHFHGGIDIKTGGVEGKSVFSVGDGYVSAVSIGVAGLGNTIYIRHPEGYTSVYCHLKCFMPYIVSSVRKWQYNNRRSIGYMTFKPNELIVSKGQLIALSGNTGASTAPHLHFEIHETKTGNMCDPLDFIGENVPDGQPPMAHAFMAYPQEGAGTFCNGTHKQSFGFTSHELTRSFTAWGKVGFGLWANDYMESTYNHYGVKKTELYVDDNLIFTSEVSKIHPKDNRQVNVWGDYEHFQRYRVWYMKSFLCDELTLPIFSADTSKGIINFNEQRRYKLTFVLSDFKQNESRYTFYVDGKPTPLSYTKNSKPAKKLSTRRRHVFRLPDMQLSIPARSLPREVMFNPVIRKTASGYYPTYSFTNQSTPLLKEATLSLKVKNNVPDHSKLYIVNRNMPHRHIKTTYQDGWLHGKIGDLGATYEIAYDETPPKILPNIMQTTATISMNVSDTGSGVSSYEGYIDGKYVLFEEVPRSSSLRCDLRKTPIKPNGKMRRIELIAVDYCGNKSIYKSQIKY